MTSPLTPEELSEIEKRAEEATPGPWIPKHIKTLYFDSGDVEHEVRSRKSGKTVASIRFHPTHEEVEQEDNDLVFISFARSDIPALLSSLRFSREREKRLREALGLLTTLHESMVMDAEHPLEMAQEIHRHVMHCMEIAWGVIANASGGDWTKESADWQAAAARWRDECWHPKISARAALKENPEP